MALSVTSTLDRETEEEGLSTEVNTSHIVINDTKTRTSAGPSANILSRLPKHRASLCRCLMALDLPQPTRCTSNSSRCSRLTINK